jgi:hypothetical protein
LLFTRLGVSKAEITGSRRQRLLKANDMIRATFLACLTALALVLAETQAVGTAPLKRLLILDFEIVDTSNEPVDRRAEHERRLTVIRDAIGEEFTARRICDIVDRAPIRKELDAILEHQFLRSCNGCELPLAQRAGADFVMLGKLNKISTLVGSMDILIKDAKTGAPVYAQIFGFRGDTDQAWLRAAKFFAEGFARKHGDVFGAAGNVEP